MIRISRSGPLLKLAVEGEYRDAEWADSFAEIQIALLSGSHKQSKISVFALDLTQCAWADPVPLLTSLLAGARFIKDGGQVDVYLPIGGTDDESSIRFVKFLAQEGFLRECLKIKCGLFNSKNVAIDEYEVEQLADRGTELAYQNAKCIPAEILELVSEGNAVERECERITSMPSFDLVLRERVPGWAREKLKYKIYQVLFETISNVFEHAYAEGQPRLCGIYVRYRAGALGLPQELQQSGEELLWKEHRSCPRLDREFLDAAFGAFEIFIVDAGKGLVRSLQDAGTLAPNGVEPAKYPFQWMTQYVFGRPIAKRRQSKSTEFGGLYLIHQLLSSDRDYVRGFDDRTWIGDFVPVVGHPQHVLAQQPYQGLIWHFRLGWKEKTDVGNKWHAIGHGSHEAALEALRDENTLRDKTKSYWCLDQRFGADQEYKRGTFHQDRSAISPECIIWFVPPNLTKSDIYARLEKQVLAASETRSGKQVDNPKTLFIVDVPAHEAQTYVAAFENAEVSTRKYEWATKVDCLILLSRHFAYCAFRAERDNTLNKAFVRLERDDDYYRHNAGVAEIAGRSLKGPFSPRKRLSDLIRWIKWHDSERFWSSLSNHHEDLCYVPEEVAWGIDELGRPKKLRGYLDFSQALADSLCRRILFLAASRLPGLTPSSPIELRPLDSMSGTVANDLYWSDHSFSNSQPQHSTKGDQGTAIALGSVYVTGATERSMAGGDGQLVVHFFKHPDASAENKRPHLLYWPKQEDSWFKDLFQSSGLSDLKRIGSTSAISERGWKYFELPRYDLSGKLIAARSPKDTYFDWQRSSPVVMKTGHWVYGSQHDLLTVNLALALRESFLLNSDMGCFLLFNFFRLLGVSQDHLNTEGRIWWDQVFSGSNSWIALARERLSEKQHSVDEVAVVIYPSHHNTELMVAKFLSLLLPAMEPTYRARLLAIRGVRARYGGSANLLQPLTLVRLERQLGTTHLKTVAYLDDAIITGRTLREASTLIFQHGGELTQAVVVLDRQRMPADDKVGKLQVRHYWRLDVPVMGYDRSCPLCHATTVAQAFVGALASQRAKARVLDLVDAWKAVSPSFDWTRGLPPVALGFAGAKRFSLRKGSNLGDPIELNRSTGLTAWVSELHAMTCEDALATSIARSGLDKHGRNSKIVRPDALVEMLSSQILLFGDEYSNEELQKLLLELFRAAMALKGRGDHTGLALMVLISQSHNAMKSAGTLWDQALLELAPRFPEMPEDLQIATAFLLHLGVISHEKHALRDFERLLSSRASKIAGRYSQLHNEVFDFDGNQHSGPLSRIFQWGPSLTKHGLILGMNSIDKLTDLVGELEVQTAYVPQTDPEVFRTIRADLREALSHASDCLATALGAAEVSSGPLKRDEEAITAVGKVLQLGTKFHACFFVDIEVEQLSQRRFEEKSLAAVLERAGFSREEGAKNRFAFSRCVQPRAFSRKVRKCVCWDHETVQAISDIAANTIDMRPIGDPWSSNSGVEATAWIRVDYQNSDVVISVANASDTSLGEIRSRLRQNAQRRWGHLFSLGGRVFGPSKIDGQPGVVAMAIQIPIAGFLMPDKHIEELEKY